MQSGIQKDFWRVYSITKLFMIMLDAFGYNQVISDSSIFLNELIQESIFGKIEPLLAFRGIQPTIFSGLNPNKHGIWMDYLFDEEKSSYKWTKKTLIPSLEHLKNRVNHNFIQKVVTAPICYASKYIYNYSQFPRTTLIPWNQLKYFRFSMTEKITRKGVLKPYETIFDIFNKNDITYHVVDFPDVHSDSDTIKRINLVKKNSFKKDFYFFRFFDLDGIIHDNGLNSEKTRKCLIKTANLIKNLKKMIEKNLDDYFLLIFSDHGMVHVNEEINTENLLNEIRKKIGKSFHYFIDSTMIRFKLDDKSSIEKLKDFLDEKSYGIVLNEDFKKIFNINIPDSLYGDVVFVLNKGKIFLPNFFQGYNKIKAMHGYYEKDKNLNPFLMLYNKKNNMQRKLEIIKFADIVPTILDIFKISPNINYEGHSLLNE